MRVSLACQLQLALSRSRSFDAIVIEGEETTQCFRLMVVVA
jgi:hypothetical protein